MYTRKRKKHRGGSSRSGTQRLVRTPSLGMRIIRSKTNRRLRSCILSKGCRFTLLEKVVLSNVLLEFKRIGITDPFEIRKRLDERMPILLSDPQINSFILGNKLGGFTGIELTHDKIDEIQREGQSQKRKRLYSEPVQRVLPVVIVRTNGYIAHYLSLIYEDKKWYAYGSYGSDYVNIQPSKIPIDISEFLAFAEELKSSEKTPQQKQSIVSYVKRVFLPSEHSVQSMGVDESGSRDRKIFIHKEKGIDKEANLFIGDTQYRVLYVPEFYQHVKDVLQSSQVKPSTLNSMQSSSTFSAVSANAASAIRGHRTQNSGP